MGNFFDSVRRLFMQEKILSYDKGIRAVCLSLIFFALFVVFLNIPSEQKFLISAKGSDEGYYYEYAKNVREGGISQFPIMLEHYLQDQRSQLFPHPVRIGHVVMTALWFKFCPATFVSLARFSFFCFVLLLIVSFCFCRKYFGQNTAYFYTTLLSCSPLLMSSGRRALQDSNVNLFWILAVWLFLDFLTEKKKSKFIIFLLVFSLAIMIKESAAILLVFFTAAFILYKYKYKQNLALAYLGGLFMIPACFIGMIYAICLKSLGPVIAIIKFIAGVHFPRAGVVVNGYCVFCMGPWYKFIIDFLILSPATLLLAIGYFFYLLFCRNSEWKQTYFMLYIVGMVAMLGAMKYTKIVRFAASLDMVFCLFAVLALYALLRRRDEDKQACFVLIAVICIFFLNLKNFIHLFLTCNIYDPVSYFLLAAKNIIPMFSY